MDASPRKRVGYCRAAARSLLDAYRRTHHEDMPPVPVFEIAAAEGFEVHQLDSLPDEHSALVLHAEHLIGLNQRHHRHRQRFSVAHELAHIRLGHPPESDLPRDRARTYNQEADEFAGELLVPLSILKQQLRLERKLGRLAVLFDVSTEVLVIRLTDHGLLDQVQ